MNTISQGLFRAKLADTQPATLKHLAEAAVAASQAFSELSEAPCRQVDDFAFRRAEKRAEDARAALLDHLLDSFGIGSALARELGLVLS